MGYIGYVTFVIALLREQGASGSDITVFYPLLGAAVVASSRIWAGLLDLYKGGRVLALLNGLLSLATLLPAVTAAWPVVLASGVLFGAVFLSLVASTNALVRHNLPQAPGVRFDLFSRCAVDRCWAGVTSVASFLGPCRMRA